MSTHLRNCSNCPISLLLAMFLTLLTGCGGGGGSAPSTAVVPPPPPVSSLPPITVSASPTVKNENLKTGSTAWVVNFPAAPGELEGYASLTSVNRGGEIKLFVNTTAAQYTIEFFRMGWYGATGARSMGAPIIRTGIVQPVCPTDPVTLMTECNWTDPYVLTIPSSADPTDWASGVYLAKLGVVGAKKEAYIIFVVRDDQRHAELLAQTSATTYQAYNPWGGQSLYTTPRSSKVSFDRPYVQNHGAGDFLYWEMQMVRFLEREGYDVSYSTDLDTHGNRDELFHHFAILSFGHDEYWSWQMRDNMESARQGGVNLAFFTANSAYWQVRFEPSVSSAIRDRVMVCYKSMDDPLAHDADPSNDHLVTTRFRDSPARRPEDALIGVAYMFGPVQGDIVVENTSHWVFANTQLKDGDHLPGLLGPEADKMLGNAPPGITRIGHSPLQTSTGASDFADMTVYQYSSGATVFAAGTIQWDWGLDGTQANAAAQQITRNVLTRFGAHKF